MKISKLREIKRVHRPTQYYDSEGNRFYDELEIEINFISTIKTKGVERFFAKIIDLTPFVFFFHFLVSFNWIQSVLISIPFLILMNSVLEFYYGKSFGKSILKLKVMDDEGNHPNLTKSFLRNLYSLANLLPSYSDTARDFPTPAPATFAVYGRFFFSMHLNLKWTKTFVVDFKEWQKIKELSLIQDQMLGQPSEDLIIGLNQ
jgi:uncharacterized RDD family membrane protein YckC